VFIGDDRLVGDSIQGRAGKIRGPMRNPKIGPIIIKFKELLIWLKN
jgi:hypothetical protein